MSSEIKVTNIKHADSNSNNFVLGSDGTTTVSGALTASGGIANAGTISAGTISDTVTQPDALYVTGNVVSHVQVGSSGDMINLTGTTPPYMTFSGGVNSFGNGSGNVTGSTDHDFKFLTKGIYFISFNLVTYFNVSNETRQFLGAIRGNGSASESTSVLAESKGNIANTTTDNDLSSCCATYVGLFNANDQINFFVRSYNRDDVFIEANTHVSIFLVRTVS